MPSPQHQLLTRVIPVIRRRSEVHDPEQVRRDVLARQARADPSPPRRVARAFDVSRTDRSGLPVFELAPTGTEPVRTVLYLHGGGFVSGLDRFHWRYAARLERKAMLDDGLIMPPRQPGVWELTELGRSTTE